MQKGIHIGKIVLSLCPEESKSLSASSAAHSISFNPDASYVLIGGLGGLGKAVSTWMVENGARHLVYLSRNAGKSPDDEAFFNELESQDCSTRVVQGSVVKEEDVRLALKQNNRPIKGIFQMSMVLRDQAFLRMTHEEWMTAVQPKVQGTWNLHNVALELGLELDFFVMFSSLSGIIGQLGQANYSAGNTFLDAFVQYRQRKNLPASVINIGVIEDSGYLVRNVHMLRKLHAAGQYGIREPELLDALSQAVGTSTSPRTNGNAFINSSQTVIGLRSTMPLSSPQNRLIWRTDRRMAFYCIEMDAKSGNAAANGNTDKLREFIETASNNPTILSSKISADFLARQIAARLYIFLLKPIEDESEIDITPSLSDVGLDSLVAIEMRAWWRQAFGFDISVLEMLGMGSIAALGKHAADGLMVKFEEEEGKNHLGDTDNGKQRDGYLAMKAP
jgi:NAD(P)-dependent dehydrogenase (short-subunit alcohol dehydrogenase family)/aryl carrier-like protein